MYTCIRSFSFLKCLPSEYKSIFCTPPTFIAIQTGDAYSSLISGTPLSVRIREKMGNLTNKRPTSQSGYFDLSVPNIVSCRLWWIEACIHVITVYTATREHSNRDLKEVKTSYLPIDKNRYLNYLLL